MPSGVGNVNLPAQAFQHARLVDSNGRTNTNSHDALAVLRCVNDECHDTLTKHQPYTGFGPIMRRRDGAAASRGCERFHAASRPARRGAKAPPTCRSKVAGPFLFLRAGWLPLLKMRASKQAIVPCIMLPKAHNFGWATLGMDRLLGSSSQRGSLGWHLRDWSPRLGI